MGDVNPIRTLEDYSKPSHEGYMNNIELPIGNNVVPFRSDTIWLENLYLKHALISRTYYKKSLIMASTFGSKSKSFMTMSIPSQDEPLTNRDFAKSVKAISLPQDVLSTYDRRLIELENQVQRLMEVHLALTQPTQVNKITTSCEIYNGPHDTQYFIKDPEQAFVEYASSRTDEVGGPNRDGEGIEWLDVEEPLDLVDTSEESIYESLIKEMPKCSLNYDDKIKKGDPRNLRIPRMGKKFHRIRKGHARICRKYELRYRFHHFGNIETNIDPSLSHVIFGRPFIEIACLAINRKHGLMTFTDETKEITFKTPYKDPQRSKLFSEGHDLLSSRVKLSEDDYDRGCGKPSDLEEGFYRDTIKLGPEYMTGMDDEGEVTRSKQPCIHEESPVDTMADQRTMAELLRAPTEGYAEAIVVPPILAEQFELKHSLINMMTSDQFFGLEKDNHHDHIRWFNKITSTIKYKDVPNSAIKLVLFPLPLAGAARWWLEKETPHSILTWEDLVSKFINEFFPPQEQQISIMKSPIFNNAGGNTFPELKDNIRGYIAAAAVNYNQGNSVYRPPAINTRIGIVIDGPSILIPPQFINQKEDERVEETLTDQDLAEYTIKNESINLINVFNDSNEDFLEDLFPKNQPSGNPTFPSHPELTLPKVKDGIFEPEGGNVLPEKLLDLDSTKDLHPPLHVNPLSGCTTSSSSPNQLLEEFADELTLITFPPGNDDLQFDIETDLKEIEYLLHHDPIKDIDSILKDSIDQSNLADNDNLVDSMPEMFVDEHALDYSSPPLFDEYDDDLFEVESDTENVYDDPFDSKGEKIKESKLLIDELDLPCDFLPSFEYDSILYEDFSKVDDLPSTNNEDKVFNSSILIQENLFENITYVAPEKKDKKLAISHASLMIEDFDPPLYELPFFKEVPRSKMLLTFSSENEEKVFKPWIHTSEKVHSSFITELCHQGYKVFKINQIFKSPMKIFLFSYRKDTHISAVPCLHFYPLGQFKYGEIGSS
nr:reverse transcriptase domain-containing protein [Tanacetum cinerariifolium]